MTGLPATDRLGRVICLMVFIALTVYYIYYSRVFLDAGFYMHAADQVVKGKMLYTDFFFVQAPVYPYVYGFLQSPWHVTLEGSRWISAGFSLAVVAIVFFSVRRIVMPGTVWIVLVSLACAPLHVYFFSSVKLYALAGFFITGAGAAYSGRLPVRLRLHLTVILAILAAGTRLTILPGSLILVLAAFRDSVRERRRLLIELLFSATGLSAVLSLPFILKDLDAVLYNLIRIHVSAASGLYVFGWLNKMKVLGQIAAAYPVAVMILVLAFVRLARQGLNWQSHRADWINLTAAGLVTAAHFSANWFSTDYQSVIMPLAVISLSRLAFERSRSTVSMRWVQPLSLILLVGGLCYGFRLPVWPGEGSSLGNVQNTGEYIAANSSPGDVVAVNNAVYAFAAGREPVEPFGGAPFTFTPNWTETRCHRFGGINIPMLVSLLDRQIPRVLIFEKDSFSIGFPGFFQVPQADQELIFNAIRRNYQPAGTFPNLGDGSMTLQVYLPLIRRSEVL